MEEINRSLFLFLNADEGTKAWLLDLSKFIAIYFIYIIPVVLVLLYANRQTRKASILIFSSVVLSCLMAKGLSFVIFHPRPFMVPLGHNFLFHVPETSFPSNHGSAIFSFAMASYFWFRRIFGMIMLLIGCAIAWARVFLGVHFPFDMIGAFFVSLLSCLVVWQALLYVSKIKIKAV